MKISQNLHVICVLWIGTWFTLGGTSPVGAEAEAEGPLVLTPENTVILDGSTYAGRTLQYYLIKFYVGEKEAEAYALNSKVNRSESPWFPLYRGKASVLPEGKNVLAVGRSPFLTEEDRQQMEAEPIGAFLIRRHGKTVVIAGWPMKNPWVGNYKAMALFLDKVCGIRFYAPGDLWTSRPKEKTISIGRLDIFQKEFFLKYNFGQYFKRNTEWLRMNPEGQSNMRGNHSLARIFPPSKYYESHPGIYEQHAGKRSRPSGGAWNPCLSAKALPDLAMEYVRQNQKGPRARRYLSFGVMDCRFDCECEPCQASARQHGGSYSNLYYTFLNEVARRCQKEFPELVLTAYIYSNVSRPPEGMRIEPNIVVDFVNKVYQYVNPRALENEKREILKWSSLGARWMTHDWAFSGVAPRLYMHQYAAFLQWAAQNGMIGIYAEWSPGEYWYLQGAKYWILKQLFLNPYQDVDARWKQYCDDMYGGGSEEMFRLFRHFADKYVYSDTTIKRSDMPRREMAMFTQSDLDYQRSLLQRARQLTQGDGLIQQRFDFFERYFRAHELFVQAVGKVSRLDHQFQGEGINSAALEFYLTDDGTKLRKAVEYYDTRRTVLPDENVVNRKLSARASYINNYSRSMGKILLAIHREAEKAVDLSKVNRADVDRLVVESKRILRANLPARYLHARLKMLESILDKTLWIPRAQEMPEIDGKLDDSAWKRAAALEGFSIRDTLLPSSNGTEGRIMRVGDHLLLGLVCHQARPIWARTTPDIYTGTRIWRESCCEFFFAPASEKEEGKPRYIQYIVNALGAFRGFGEAKGNREGCQAAVEMSPAGEAYTIEFALPLKTPQYDYSGHRAFSFNIMRDVFHANTYSADEIIGWYPIFYSAQYPESRGLVFVE